MTMTSKASFWNGSGRFATLRDAPTTSSSPSSSSSWKTLYTHMRSTDANDVNIKSNKQQQRYRFRSQHHSHSFHTPLPVGSKHDLWSNELLSVLLPTYPLMHLVKYLSVSLLLLTLTVGSMRHMSSTVSNVQQTETTTIASKSSPSSSFGYLSFLPWWMYLGLWLLWTHWYYYSTLCHFGKPWMDPNCTGCGQQQQKRRRQEMHTMTRLHNSSRNSRRAACRPDLACFSTTTTTTVPVEGVSDDDKSRSKKQQRPNPQQHVASNLTNNVWLLDPLPSWKFQLYHTVEQALEAVRTTIHHGDHTTNDWMTEDDGMPIPSNWMLHPRVNDIPIYTNQKYPFPCQPPMVPVQNPTGVYQLEFQKSDATLWPQRWNNDTTDIDDDDYVDDDDDAAAAEYSILLHGIESACFVYWNGHLLGYYQDSRLPSEFVIPNDILWNMKNGETTTTTTALLQLVVLRWSDGSYLEDQDHWWMAGIHRSVEIVRRPPSMDIMDYHVLTNHDGQLQVAVSVRDSASQNAAMQEQKTIRLRLYVDEQLSADGTNYKLAEKPLWTATQSVRGESVLTFDDTIPSIRPWTAETPNLYTLVVEQLDNNDQTIVVQCESCRVGFRTVAIDPHQESGSGGGILKVNGNAITVCGMNRHEHDPDHGKVVSLDKMMQDITVLKQNNFNAIRTSHYPAHSSFYRLCDYYGMYVCDEANIETHGMKPMGRLAHDAGWEQAFVSRVTRMVQRDYNHACIILWSLGNEAGRGRNLIRARQRLLDLDTSRPICYESGGLWGEGTGRSELTDVVCPMYTSVPRLEELHNRKDEDRPIVLCEYSHSMNNSNGNLHLYWEKFWDPSFPRLQGGFIWDFKDQGLRQKSKDGRSFFAYGGDFGDVINDQQFCINGMFSPDLEPHPSVHEIKYLQQPVKVSVIGEPLLRISKGSDSANAPSKIAMKLSLVNRYTFQNLSHLQWKWELCCSISQYAIASGNASEEDGRILKIDLSVAVAHLRELETKYDGLRYCLIVSGHSKEDASWVNAGHVIVREQFSIQVVMERRDDTPQTHPLRRDNQAKVSVEDTEHTLRIWSQDKEDSHPVPMVVFGKSSGEILSLCWDGKTDILGRNGLTHNFTRATTDNDRGGLELVLEHMMLKWAQPAFFLSKGYQHFSHYMHWKENGLSQHDPPVVGCDDMTFVQKGHLVIVKANCSIKNSSGNILLKQITTYEICGQTGEIQIHCQVMPQRCLRNIPSLPRIGMSLELNPSLHRIQFYGRGPNECYPDRKSGSDMGVWKTRPSQMGSNYIVPSENGNRSDCQWASFDDENGNGLLIVAGSSKKKEKQAADGSSTFEFSALLHSANDLNQARHTCDLDERVDGQHPIFVNIDHQLMGLGGDVSWLPCVYPEFLVKADRDYDYSLRLAPLLLPLRNDGRGGGTLKGDHDDDVAVLAHQIMLMHAAEALQ